MSVTGHEPETSTATGSDGGDAEVSAAGDVVRRAGDVEAVEIVHRNDSVTRLSSDTVLSRPPSTGGDGPAIGLTRGSSWHRVADNDDGFRVELPKGSASSTDGVFTVVCEPNGSAFVVCLEGQVLVEGDDNGTVLRSMQAVDLSPNGALGEAIDVTADELQTDPWVVANQSLGHAAAAASVAARLPVAEQESPVAEVEAPEVEPEVEAPEITAEPEARETAEAEAEAEAPEAEVIGANAALAEPEAEPEEASIVEAPPAEEQDEAGDGAETATAGATAVLTVPDLEEGAAEEEAAPEDEAEEEAEEARDHVIVVGRGERRQPTLWVALVLAVIAVALFAIARKTENDRTGTQIDEQTATTVAPGPAPTDAVPATSTPTTEAPSTATTAAPVAGVTYDISLTKCSQSGTAIAAEGAITNKANVSQNYRIVVRFLGADKVTKVAEADATLQNVAPKQRVSWKATGTYGGNLRNAGGCETERVDIV